MILRSLLLACALAATATAAAETKQCTPITSVPYDITVQGAYCLHQDLVSHVIAGRTIDIATSNVTLDCNGHTIDGSASGPGTRAFGVMAMDRLNVSVRGCHLRGFQNAIWLRGGGATVEDNLVDRSTSQGIYVHGGGSVVRRNRVFDTGGGTVDNGGHARGIRTYGDVDVLDNTVAGVHATAGSGGLATGVRADVNANGVIAGNRIRDLVADGVNPAMGITITGTVRASLHGNRLSNAGVDAIGLLCPFHTAGIASDNHVNGFTTGIQGCIDGGDNVLE